MLNFLLIDFGISPYFLNIRSFFFLLLIHSQYLHLIYLRHKRVILRGIAPNLN